MWSPDKQHQHHVRVCQIHADARAPPRPAGSETPGGGGPPSGDSEAAEVGEPQGSLSFPGAWMYMSRSHYSRGSLSTPPCSLGTERSSQDTRVCREGCGEWRQPPAHCCANLSKVLVWSVLCQNSPPNLTRSLCISTQSPRTAKPSVECAFSTSLKHRSNTPRLTKAPAGLVLMMALDKIVSPSGSPLS